MEAETQDKLRVSYRFNAETVEALKTAQTSDNELYNGRSMTWLIERAIMEKYGDKPASNGHA